MLWFLLQHLVPITACMLLSHAIGARLLQAVGFASASEAIAARTTLGLGVLGHLLLALGLAGLLTRPAVTCTLLACALLCARELGRSLLACARVPGQLVARVREVRGTIALPWLVLLAAGLVFLGALLVHVLHPPNGWDDLAYHLPHARLHAETGHVEPHVHLRYPVFPQQIEMLYAGMLLFGDARDAQLVHASCALLVALWLHAHVSRSSGPAGIWAAALWLGNPIVLYLAGVCYVDLGLALFGCAGVLAWLRSRDCSAPRDARAWLWLSAACLGFACGTKYLGLVFVVLVSTALLVSWARAAHAHAQVPAHVPAPATAPARREVLVFITLLVLAGAPWYVFDWLHAGNPVFPFFATWFDNRWWNAEDLAGQMKDLAEHSGSSWSRFVQWPWLLVFDSRSVRAEASFSGAMMLLAPLALYFALRAPRVLRTHAARGARAALAFACGYVVLVALLARVPRYFVAGLPLLCVAIALPLEALLRRVPAAGPRAGWVTLAITCVTLLPAARAFWWWARLREPLPVTAQEQRRYQLRALPARSLLEELERERGTDYRLYALSAPYLAYETRGGFWGDWFGPGRYGPVEGFLQEPERVHAHLRGLGVSHLLIDTWARQLPLPDGDPGFARWFTLRAARAGAQLFALANGGGAAESSPATTGSEPDAARSFAALRSEGWSESVRPHQLYWIALRASARGAARSAARGSAEATLQVWLAWSSATGERLLEESRALVFPAQPVTRTFPVTAPGEAALVKWQVLSRPEPEPGEAVASDLAAASLRAASR